LPCEGGCAWVWIGAVWIFWNGEGTDDDVGASFWEVEAWLVLRAVRGEFRDCTGPSTYLLYIVRMHVCT